MWWRANRILMCHRKAKGQGQLCGFKCGISMPFMNTEHQSTQPTEPIKRLRVDHIKVSDKCTNAPSWCKRVSFEELQTYSANILVVSLFVPLCVSLFMRVLSGQACDSQSLGGIDGWPVRWPVIHQWWPLEVPSCHQVSTIPVLQEDPGSSSNLRHVPWIISEHSSFEMCFLESSSSAFVLLNETELQQVARDGWIMDPNLATVKCASASVSFRGTASLGPCNLTWSTVKFPRTVYSEIQSRFLLYMYIYVHDHKRKEWRISKWNQALNSES